MLLLYRTKRFLNRTATSACERKCTKCGEWKHHSRFHTKTAGNTTVARFSPICRDCELKAASALMTRELEVPSAGKSR